MFSCINYAAEISMCVSAASCVLCAFIGKFREKFANIILLLLLIFAACITYKQKPDSINYLLEGFYISEISILAKRMTLILAGVVFFLFMGIKEQKKYSESYAMYSISVLGILISISSSNMITMYVGLELQIIPLYVMSSFSCNLKKSSDSAVKYYIFGIISSSIMLMGISFIYCAVQTLDFIKAGQAVSSLIYGSASYSFFIFGFLFFLIGFCFKLAVFPAYFWLPDVYQHSSTSFVLFVSSVPKIGNIFLLSNIINQMVSGLCHYYNLVYIFLLIGVLSILLGSFGAISQSNFRRFIAYSSLNNIGFIFALIPSFVDINLVMVYVFVYSIMIVGIFACVISICNEEEILNNLSFSQLNNLFRNKDKTSFIMLSLLLSMAGIPPFAGFISKLYILFSFIKNWNVETVICFAVLTLLSIYYYLNVIFQIFVVQKDCKDNCENHNTKISTSKLATFVATSCFFVNCIFVFHPSLAFLNFA